MICASWPAPDGSRIVLWPNSVTLAASASMQGLRAMGVATPVKIFDRDLEPAHLGDALCLSAKDARWRQGAVRR